MDHNGSMKLSRLILFCALLFAAPSTWAATELPRSLSPSDQRRALEILGFGTSSKILDNPYPLGGYSGVEIGLSSEYIPIDDLAALGSTSNDKGEMSFYTLMIGKGLYYNVDIHFYFTPTVQNDDVSSFGGQFRWGFYEASFFPITFTTIAYAGGANFSNLINVATTGVDLVASVNIKNVALYFGGGRVRAIGRFIGGADGITDDNETHEQDLFENHTVFGVNVNVQKFFVAFEIDRYVDSVYSGKLGVRF